MLTLIVHPSPACHFCEMLGLRSTEPQKQHLINLADAAFWSLRARKRWRTFNASL